MALYRKFVPDLTGVALYLQICGVLLYAAVTWVLYKELVRFIDYRTAHYMCMFFFVFRAKQSVFPEFSNMQICFSVLLFVFLLKFYRNQEKKYYLIFAALFLCLEIISYPTCIVVFFGVLGLLYAFGKRKLTNIALFTGTCAICGGGYLAAIVSGVGFGGIVKDIRFIMQADASHGAKITDIAYYFRGFMNGAIWIAVVAAVSFLICLFIRNKITFFSCFGYGLLLTEIVLIFISRKQPIDWNCQYFIILLLLICLGIRGRKYLNPETRMLYRTGMVISLLSAVSVAFLTNLEFLSIMGYLILGALVSFVSLDRMAVYGRSQSNEGVGFIVAILALFIFHRAMIVCGYANEAGIKLTIDLENVIRAGPAKGIVTSLQKCNEVKGTLADWQRFVKEDSILVVVPWMSDPIVYVDQNTKVSTFSTINTPTYNESLLYYWDMYPEKIPTIIAVEGWNGEISVDKNTWIMKWIEDTYTVHEDGEFWRFYRKE